MVITICFERSARVHFFDLGWLWGVILGGVGDLWDHFCDFLEVRKTIEILRWILEAKSEKNTVCWATGPGGVRPEKKTR